MSEKKLSVGVEINYLNQGQGIERAALELIRVRDAAVAAAREGKPALDQLEQSQEKQTDESQRQREEAEKLESANQQNVQALKLLKDASEVASGSLRPLPGMLRDIASQSGAAETALSNVAKGLGTAGLAVGAFSAGFKIGELLGDAAIAMDQFLSGAALMEETLLRVDAAADKLARRHMLLQDEIKKTTEQMDSQLRRIKEIADAEDSLDKARSARSAARANLEKAQIAAGAGTAGEKAVGAAMVDREQATVEFQQERDAIDRQIVNLRREHQNKATELNRLMEEQEKLKREQNEAERAYKEMIEGFLKAGGKVDPNVMSGMMTSLYNGTVAQFTGNFKPTEQNDINAARQRYSRATDALGSFENSADGGKQIADLKTTLDVLPKKIEEAKLSLEKVGDDYKTKLVEAGGKLEEAGKQIKADIEAAAKTLEEASKARQEAQSARQAGGGPAEDAAYAKALAEEQKAAAELQRLRMFMEQLTPALSTATAQIIQEQAKHADALIRSSQDMSTRIAAVQKESATIVATAARESGGEQERAIRDASNSIISAIGDLAEQVGSISQKQAAQQAAIEASIAMSSTAGRTAEVAVSQGRTKPAGSLLDWKPIAW